MRESDRVEVSVNVFMLNVFESVRHLDLGYRQTGYDGARASQTRCR